ncbi:peptidyl-dipeptidase Dcp [Microcella putealis]|uniref:Peptidyl-dipeptidase Dcp n=1 Tax=Microcella putealis TaxID=337005 RepID=A0A4Q7LY00_9MICO|nr:M3 family metallopeptidase [Microcella putealis]RZS59347.1 peptidyl-dipeptidase Dcp [Microcella putealis]TQM19972.1 peptidyl-dipeptidase Dcp [Microcella putealis]
MTNPFFAPSTLPYQLPPFAEITDDHYAEAIEAGMAEQRREIEAITAQADEPTFANTIEPLERSGQLLGRVLRVFFNKSSADSNDATNALEERYAALLSAHEDAISLDATLFARIDALYAQRDSLDLSDDQRYLIERRRTEMFLAGAGLDDAAKARLSELNGRLSTLSTKFQNNLLADTNDLAVVVDDVAELDGLTSGEIAACAQAAADRGLDGKYLITLVLPTGHPYLASLTNRELRERVMRASRARGSRGNDHDNREVLLEMVRLRAERAELLGFDSHSAFITANQTAKTADNVAAMLDRLAPAAARNALAEQEKLEAIAGHPIEAHDWAFYSEKVRAAEFDVDTAALRPYFEAERVLHHGVFAAATRVFGITFAERTDLVGYHPEARVFEVYNEDGSELGLYVLDLYTRDSKRGGAWMNSFVEQNELLGQRAVVVNNLNVPKPSAGEPTLLTFDEVNTFFHEFGHALHGLLAHVTYPSQAGTNVFRDFVEFPSQVNEMWMLWPGLVEDYARHHVTGEPIPAETIEKIRASETWGEGFATNEYLAASLLDQAWHRLSAEEANAVTDVAAFEAAALARAGLDNPAVPTRYSSTYFAHIFAGGYGASYYGYIWSEVLDADTVEWFKENGGLTRANGDRFREYILGIGGTRDPLESYREFRGREAVIEPLLTRRGLAA